MAQSITADCGYRLGMGAMMDSVIFVPMLVPAEPNLSEKYPQATTCSETRDFFASAPRGACHDACVLCAHYSDVKEPTFFLTYVLVYRATPYTLYPAIHRGLPWRR